MGLGMRLDSTRSFRGHDAGRHTQRGVGQDVRAGGRTKPPRHGRACQLRPCGGRQLQPNQPGDWRPHFGESVEWVSKLGQAYADGLQDQRVLATAKHFPGHGDSDSDSHATLPSILHDRGRLDSVELAPFQHAFDHGMGGVMVAHLDVPGLDSTEAQPSTLSPAIVDTLLRQEMGFEGLVFTDAMSMKGFADFAGGTAAHWTR